MNMFLVSLMLLAGVAVQSPAAESPSSMLKRADKLRVEGSFAQARGIYEQVAAMKPAPAEANAARVWGADCLWRERSSQENIGEARKRLERAVEDLPKDETLRAEAAESLGDLQHEMHPWEGWEEIYEPWEKARDFWGTSTEPGATKRYVGLNFKIAQFLVERIGGLESKKPRFQIRPVPPDPDQGPLGFELCRDAMRNVLRVSEDPGDRTRALLLLGQAHLRHVQDQKVQQARHKAGIEYLRQACAIKPNNEWTDDALWTLANILANNQRFVEAVEVWRELLERYKPGQTQFYDNAKRALEEATSPRLTIHPPASFAPGSYLHFSIQYRNLSKATLRIKKIDPQAYIDSHVYQNHNNTAPELDGKFVLEKQLEGLVDEGKFIPHSMDINLDPLEPAVYQVVAESAGTTNKPVFFVSSLAVAGKFDRENAELFVTNIDTGKVVGKAEVHALIFERRIRQEEEDRWLAAKGTTGDNGRATIKLPQMKQDHPHEFFAVARRGDEVAMMRHGGFYYGYFGRGRMAPGANKPIILHAYTDRPAYRPGESIQWKAIVREDSGDTYSIPDAAKYKVRIRDERNAVVHESDVSLSEFGTIQGTFTTTRATALGIMNIELIKADLSQEGVASAALCRLEEYRLPEFKVNVEPGKGPYRLGSAVPFTIGAEYYFGGPVAGATAQVVVHRAPFWPWWRPVQMYDWLYEESDLGYTRFMGGRYRGEYWGRPHAQEEVVLQKTVTLDAQGKAQIEIGALSDEQVKAARDQHFWGYSYRVEARVTDLSRREISASGSVKVALTAFAAYLYPQRYLFLPGDPVKIDLSTLDPNDKPLAAEGLVTVYKRVWDFERKNASGQPQPGYKDMELFTKPAVTGADGKALVQFEPSETGYYYIKYTTRDSFGEKVEGETTVFVAKSDTTDIGYRSGGAEIILDRTNYEQGETVQALVVTRRPGAAVWLAVEGETIFSDQVVQMKGTAQLVPIKVEARFTPNVYLTAVAMYDYSGFRDQKLVRVPPVGELLNIKIVSDKAEYRPGEQASVRVEARDNKGKPVRAELSLGVADAAVWAIQTDLAQDVRKFFWGRMRPNTIRTMASPDSYTTEFWQKKKDAPDQFERVVRERIPEVIDDLGGKVGNEMFYDRAGMATGGGVITWSFSESNTRSKGAPMASNMQQLRMESAKPASAPMPDAQAAEPRVRTNFSSTAYWMASVVTDEDGVASATFTMPDSLTTWRAASLGVTKTTQVGQVTHEVRTNKPIMVRPQVPRYFVQGDKATLSAIVTNNTSETQRVRVKIDANGLQLNVLAYVAGRMPKPDPVWMDAITSPMITKFQEVEIAVPANNQRRVDWDVTALTTGTATVRMTALSAIDSDAAEKTYPIHEYGIEKFVARAAAIREAAGETSRTLMLTIPAERREGSEGLTIWIEPTLARAMVNALPYLAEYPYGCTEQTVSRFVPAVITARVLQQLSIRNEDLEKKLPDMIKAGLERLYDFQHGDGGWGWWREGQSDPWMTAYVVQGLAQAREADVNVSNDVLMRAIGFLRVQLVEFENEEDMEAWMLYALATVNGLSGEDPLTAAAHERLWPLREKLNPYTRALFALACNMSGRTERAQILARNMMNGLVEDKANGTAHWGKERIWWRWSDGGVEATAFGLRALLAIDPKNPVVDEAMLWLVRNRRGCRWQSTRDTALVIRALADYIKVRGEDKPDWTAEVLVNGKAVGSMKVTPETIFSFEGKIDVPAELLKTGENSVVIVRRGSGVLYASAWLTFFTREEKIAPEGNEVFAERRFWRTEMKSTPSGVYKPVRTELKEGDRLKSGDRVEVELKIEAKNNYDYIVIEDLKAAGMEPVEVHSGGTGGDGIWGHKELRDEKTAFFVDRLAEGQHTLRYELRAETPGTFHALPCLMHAMYVPEIRANSSNAVIQIE